MSHIPHVAGVGKFGDGREPEADAIAIGMFIDSLRACSDPTKRRAADVIEDLWKRFSEIFKWREVPEPQMARACPLPCLTGTVYTRYNGKTYELVLPPLPEAPK